MPHRIAPRTEVPPQFRNPDFLTSDLPPSSRLGHSKPSLASGGGRSRTGYQASVVAMVIVAAGVVPGLLTWWLSGTLADGLVVGGFAALSAAAAAVMLT